MKTLSFALLLMATLAFVVLGCSDKSDSVIAPTEQSQPGMRGENPLGKATSVVSHVLVPFDIIGYSVCLGEAIHFTGDALFITHLLYDNDGNVKLDRLVARDVHWIGVSASGVTYKALEVDHISTNYGSGANVAIVKIHALLIGPKGGPVEKGTVQFHVTVTPDGTVTGSFERFETDCR